MLFIFDIIIEKDDKLQREEFCTYNILYGEQSCILFWKENRDGEGKEGRKMSGAV